MLQSMAAYLDGLAGDKSAENRLAQHDSPEVIKHRLALLLDSKQFVEAATLVEQSTINEAWCDLGIRALILGGKVSAAKSLLQEIRRSFGSEREPARLKCILAYARAKFEYIFANRESPQILPGSLNSDEICAVREVASVVQEVVARLHEDGVIKTRLELGIALIGVQVNWLLQSKQDVTSIATLLLTYSPVPHEVVPFIRLGLIDCPPNLPSRFRIEHGNIRANILAAELDIECFGKSAESFDRLARVAEGATQSDDRRDAAFLLVQIASTLDESAKSRAWQIARHLLAGNEKEMGVLEVQDLIRRGRLDDATHRIELEVTDNDPLWLQLQAQVLLRKGKQQEASRLLSTAAEMLLSPELLRWSAQISLQAEQLDQAIRAFRKILDLNPSDKNGLHTVGTLLAKNGEFGAAAEYFRALCSADPTSDNAQLNLAQCLRLVGHDDESIRIYDGLCAKKFPPLAAIFGKAQLLRSNSEVEKSFEHLQRHRVQFWDRPEFVYLWIDIAFSAGFDEAAHEGLARMTELQKLGLVTEEAFKVLPEDEILGFMKDVNKKTEERHQFLHTEMISGRMPWVWVEQMSSNAIYWGWRTRTQELSWIGDDPTNRARFSIYATNGFHARAAERDLPELLPLECPPAGTKIVADISTLITLHRLGLLDATVEYFGEVLVPAGYLPTVLEDSRSMVLHQRSRQQNAEHIAKQVKTGRIVVQAEKDKPPVGPAVVDEYTDAEGHSYRLVDVTQPVYAAGILTDTDLARVSRVSANSTAVDKDHPALAQFQDVMVGLATLETITQAGLLDAICGFYKVHITATDQREVTQRLDAIALQEETRQWHMDLWTRLRKDPRFKFVPHTIPEGIRVKDTEEKDLFPFLASFIAQETKLPLLADDRVCQAFTLNVTNVPFASFGSDTLILQLMTDSKIDAGNAAEFMRRLILWRYRFLVLPPEILKAFADMNRGNPPGQALREVAFYVHDCMRDFGLFGGREKTAMGESMAVRLYMSWIHAIAEFLVSVWADNNFTPEAATHLTSWACKEFLPSTPRVLDGMAKARTGDQTPRLILSTALLATTGYSDHSRMADAMKALKECLQMTNAEYHRIVLDVLNNTGKTAPEES
jgi:tetratricopeptide (TPR) repeat protein